MRGQAVHPPTRSVHPDLTSEALLPYSLGLHATLHANLER
jgi:hypothetical protein